jgi:hypothetical protein
MNRVLAPLRLGLAALHGFQYVARVRLRRAARDLRRKVLILAGRRLGRVLDVTDPAASRFIDVKVVYKGGEVSVEDEERRRFLQLQTTVPAPGGTVRRGDILVCSIKNARFDVRAGTVCTEDNRLILEAPWEIKRLQSSPTYGAKVPGKLKFLPGRYSAIWGTWPDAYYHWLVEYLPRLYSLKRSTGGPLELLMPATLSSFQRETLSICLPDNIRVRYMADDEWVQVEEFVYAPTVVAGTDCPCIPRDYFDYLRQCVFRRFGLPDGNEYRKNIYISRRKARKRRVRNEPEVIEFLAARGFECHVLEDLSFEEQVRLFHQANVVVAPHGAGLTNTIFSGRIRVLELLGRQPVPVFFFLSLSLGQRYHYLLSEPARRRFPCPADYERYRAAIDADFTVNLADLGRALARVAPELTGQ